MANQPKKAAGRLDWAAQMEGAWKAGDAQAAFALLEREDANLGSRNPEWWRELARQALNERKAELLELARAQLPQEAYWMGDGWADSVWANLNGHLYGSAGQDDDFHRHVAAKAAIDMPMCAAGSNAGLAHGCAAGRWRPMHAAAHHKNAKLIELYAKNGHSPDGWWEGGSKPFAPPKSASLRDSGRFSRVADMGWSSGNYVVPGQGQWSFGAISVDRAGHAGELPDSTPLVIACQRKALGAAQALVKLGARSAFGNSERPANWQAGKWMAKNALASDMAERDALAWARLALRSLAPQGDQPIESAASGAGSAPAAILAVARSAREALMASARASRMDGKPAVEEGDLRAGRGVAGLPPKSQRGFLRWMWTPKAERLEQDFWLALGLRDVARMGEWARAAKKHQARRGGQSLRVGGLSPVAWVCAMALAEETLGREENRAGLMFSREAAGAGAASFLFEPLSRELGVEAINEPVGAWGGFSAAQISAFCDAPGACKIIAGLAAGQGRQPESSLLEAAARGLSEEANKIALAQARRDPNPMAAVALWVAARAPEEAAKTLRAASAGQEGAFAQKWGESIALLRAGCEPRLAQAQKKSASSAKQDAWRELMAVCESLALSASVAEAGAMGAAIKSGAPKSGEDSLGQKATLAGGGPVAAAEDSRAPLDGACEQLSLAAARKTAKRL